MGVGDSLEAGYTLGGPIAAGTWHLVGDGILLGGAAVDVRFDVVWRAAGLDAGAGTVVATTSHHFVRPPTAFVAVPFSADLAAAAVPARAGDQLLLRFTATGGDAQYDPNGDGATRNGEIPRLDLPR